MFRSNKIVLSSSLDPGPLPDPYFDTSRSITSLVHDEQDKQVTDSIVVIKKGFINWLILIERGRNCFNIRSFCLQVKESFTKRKEGLFV